MHIQIIVETKQLVVKKRKKKEKTKRKQKKNTIAGSGD
jgi:hypothetical protein